MNQNKKMKTLTDNKEKISSTSHLFHNDDQLNNTSLITRNKHTDINSSIKNQNQLSGDDETFLIRYNHVSYLLYILGFFSGGLLCLVPIIMNYAKRHDADYTWLATHFDWQIKTFWYSLIFSAFGLLMFLLGIGVFGVSLLAESSSAAIGSLLFTVAGGIMLFVIIIWYVFRIVRGWIALSDKKPV